MANSYYDNSNEAQRFQPGTTARAEEVDAKFDQVATGFEGAEGDIDRSLKLPSEGVSQELDASAFQRRNRVVGFDKDGNLALRTGFSWRGDHAASTEYFVNDVLRDTTTKDVYVVETRHVSTTIRDDTKMALAINVADVENAKTAAQTAASNASTSETNAAGSASAASTSASNAATSETNAAGSASAASTSASNAATSETNAASSASAASTSETNAASSASSASTSATNASNSATTATNEANYSEEWATQPENTLISGAAGGNGTSDYSSLHHAAKSAGSASNASTSATNAATSESNAANSATNAANSAAAASTSESNAATSATNASNSASAASTSETNAAASEVDAGQHETTAYRWANAAENTTVVNADTIVDTGEYSAYHWSQKAQAAATGTLTYQGAHDASTGSYPGTPALGDYYKITVAGTIDGVSYGVGDSIIYNGGSATLSSGWDKLDNADAVASVNGQTGVISLSAADVGAAPSSHTHPWGEVTGKPAEATRWPDTSEVSGLTTALGDKQDNLVSGTNIKTVGGASLLGSGNVEAGGGLASVQVFESSGTWNKPAGIKWVKVIAVGGGGGGSGSGFGASGAGGGAGGTVIASFDVETLSTATSVSVNIGASGDGGLTVGSSGGSTYLWHSNEMSVSAYLGNGGRNNDPLQSGHGGSTQVSGSRLLGTIEVYGGDGESGAANNGTLIRGGAGGGTLLAPAVFFNYYNGQVSANSEKYTSYGVGGSGAGADGATEIRGGDGAPGIVIIEEYK